MCVSTGFHEAKTADNAVRLIEPSMLRSLRCQAVVSFTLVRRWRCRQAHYPRWGLELSTLAKSNKFQNFLDQKACEDSVAEAVKAFDGCSRCHIEMLDAFRYPLILGQSEAYFLRK